MSIYEKEGGETNPYVNKYATAHLPKGRECPTIWSLSGGQSISSLGEGGLNSAWGGGGGESQVSHPLYETLHYVYHVQSSSILS